MGNDDITTKLVELLVDMARSSGTTLEKLDQLQGYASNIPELKSCIEQLESNLSEVIIQSKTIAKALSENAGECPGKKYLEELESKKGNLVGLMDKLSEKIINTNIGLAKSVIVPKILLYAFCASVLLNLLLVVPQLRVFIMNLF